MFLGQHLCWPWNNIVINQSYLKNKFIIFVKFRFTISVCFLYISVIHLSFPLIFRDYSWLRLGLSVGKWSILFFLLKCYYRVNNICWPRNTSNSVKSGRAPLSGDSLFRDLSSPPRDLQGKSSGAEDLSARRWALISARPWPLAERQKPPTADPWPV